MARPSGRRPGASAATLALVLAWLAVAPAAARGEGAQAGDALAQARAGRCEEALPRLAALRARAPGGKAALLEAQCLVRLRRYAEAAPLLEALRRARARPRGGLAPPRHGALPPGRRRGRRGRPRRWRRRSEDRPEARLYRGLALLARGEAAGAARLLDGVVARERRPDRRLLGGRRLAARRRGRARRARRCAACSPTAPDVGLGRAGGPSCSQAASAERVRPLVDPGHRRLRVRRQRGAPRRRRAARARGLEPARHAHDVARRGRAASGGGAARGRPGVAQLLRHGPRRPQRPRRPAARRSGCGSTAALESRDDAAPRLRLRLGLRRRGVVPAEPRADAVERDPLASGRSGPRSSSAASTPTTTTWTTPTCRTAAASRSAPCPSPTAFVCGAAGVDEERLPGSRRLRHGGGRPAHASRVERLRSELSLGYTYYRYWAEGEEQSYAAHEARARRAQRSSRSASSCASTPPTPTGPTATPRACPSPTSST